MKSLRKILFGIMAVSMLTLTTGCYGTFGLTKKVYKWNGSVTDNKFANTLIFWGLSIIPVYGICMFVDVLIINAIEFWSGSNPIAMAEGESETQIVASGDKVFEITATKNQFHIEQIEGADAGKMVDLVYHADETAWYANDGVENVKLAQGDVENALVKVFRPDGSVEEFTMN